MSRYIRIKNELPELLEAVCYHKDCPNWLKDAIWDAVNNQDQTCIFTADYWRSRFESMLMNEEHAERKLQMYGTENPPLEDIG